MPKASNSGEQGHNFYDLMLNGMDDTVIPAIVAFGVMGRDSTGTWRYLSVSSNGAFIQSPGTSTIGNGTKSNPTPGTAVALLSATQACKSVIITGLLNNQSTVAVGTSSVTALPVSAMTGAPLIQGQTVTIPTNDVSNIYLNVSATNDGVAFLWVN